MNITKRFLSLLLTGLLLTAMLCPVLASAEVTGGTTYLVSVVPSSSGGVYSGAGRYRPGDTVTLSTTLNDGYCTMSWNVNDGSFSLPGSLFSPQLTVSFTMPERDVTVTADYRTHFYIPNHDLGNGTHQNRCVYCGLASGSPAPHEDRHSGGDGTGSPDGYCDDCGADVHVHSGGTASCIAQAVCTVCGQRYGSYTVHSYSAEWSMDENGHWHACTVCRAIDEGSREAHLEYVWPEFGDESHWKDCDTCGYQILAPEPHTLELQNVSERLEDDSFHEWHCTACAYASGMEKCTFVWKYDSNTHWEECTECGYGKSKADHDGEKSCDTCGWVLTLPAPTNLRWDTSSGTVAVWDAVEGAASYIVELWKRESFSMSILSHIVPDTSFQFHLTSLSPGNYYFTVRAAFDEVKSERAASGDVIMTSGGTPMIVGGESKNVDFIDGTAFIAVREDIAEGSISKVDMTPVSAGGLSDSTLTEEAAAALAEDWSGRLYFGNDRSFVALEMRQYSPADLKRVKKSVEQLKFTAVGWSELLELLDAEIKAKEAVSLVIDPGCLTVGSEFSVITGQGLGVVYSSDALKALLASVGTDSYVKVETELKKTELTKDEAKTVAAGWAEIVNTYEGEAQIRTVLTRYSIYELALLQQATKMAGLDDAAAGKLYELMKAERDKKKKEAGVENDEELLAEFSVNTYAVWADGTQTYIPVQMPMQYSVPVNTDDLPKNGKLSLYLVGEDGARIPQQILTVGDGAVVGLTAGNSDYLLVYEPDAAGTQAGPAAAGIIAIVLGAGAILGGGAYLLISRKKRKE